jgi:hypothetical protein
MFDFTTSPPTPPALPYHRIAHSNATHFALKERKARLEEQPRYVLLPGIEGSW